MSSKCDNTNVHLVLIFLFFNKREKRGNIAAAFHALYLKKKKKILEFYS